MKTIENEYDELKNEVRIFRDKVKGLNKVNPQASELYKGCRILFSPIRKANFY